MGCYTRKTKKFVWFLKMAHEWENMLKNDEVVHNTFPTYYGDSHKIGSNSHDFEKKGSWNQKYAWKKKWGSYVMLPQLIMKVIIKFFQKKVCVFRGTRFMV